MIGLYRTALVALIMAVTAVTTAHADEAQFRRGETLFVQRKISGSALLCARLKARVDVRGLAAAAIGADIPSV